MNITFLIGNGFDLRLGMKTKYADMYKTYIEAESSSEIICHFKDELKKDAPTGYTKWSDFEMKMAQHSCTYQTDTDFINCVRDFKEHMVKHLLQEESVMKKFFDSKFIVSECIKEFDSSINNFYNGLNMNIVNILDDLINGDPYLSFSFLTFNYTTILDGLVAGIKSTYRNDETVEFHAPIHIHGRLDGDVVLGVDNVSQLKDTKFTITRSTERAFIKPRFNAMYDQRRIDDALELIYKSDIICTYGLSLGDSDLMWKNALRNWLVANDSRHLIYYQYIDKNFSLWHRDLIMDEEDKLRDDFLNRLVTNEEEKDSIENRVHIPVGYNIFDIPSAIESGKRKESLSLVIQS